MTAAISAFFLCAVFFFSALRPVSDTANAKKLIFEVAKGDGFREIVDRLKNENLIRSSFAVKLFSILTGNAIKLKSGRYALNSGMNSWEIIGTLIQGSANEISLLIPEGSSVYDIDRILSDAGILKRGQFKDFISKKEKEKNGQIEGKLFPDTYKFFADSGPEDITDKMLNNFRGKTVDIFRDMSPSEINRILIMASLLEKEVPNQKEAKLVAGILGKRLRAGMPLQVDATICYLKKIKAYPNAGNCSPLRPLDFKIDSPYNSYLYKGLPPGAIANPGIAAIQAAAQPQKSGYWFYLSDPATKKTVFAATLEEQKINRLKYLGF